MRLLQTRPNIITIKLEKKMGKQENKNKKRLNRNSIENKNRINKK